MGPIRRGGAAPALVIGILLAACGLPSGPIDEACATHRDPIDCQAALEAARGDLGSDLELFRLTVAPIECTDDGCTTYVSSIPIEEDACLPHGEVEVGRGRAGAWSVLSISHGDPPCAFEP